jgi:hypothetical protein
MNDSHTRFWNEFLNEPRHGVYGMHAVMKKKNLTASA